MVFNYYCCFTIFFPVWKFLDKYRAIPNHNMIQSCNHQHSFIDVLMHTCYISKCLENCLSNKWTIRIQKKLLKLLQFHQFIWLFTIESQNDYKIIATQGFQITRWTRWSSPNLCFSVFSFPSESSLSHIYSNLLEQHLRNPSMKFPPNLAGVRIT